MEMMFNKQTAAALFRKDRKEGNNIILNSTGKILILRRQLRKIIDNFIYPSLMELNASATAASGEVKQP